MGCFCFRNSFSNLYYGLQKDSLQFVLIKADSTVISNAAKQGDISSLFLTAKTLACAKKQTDFSPDEESSSK